MTVQELFYGPINGGPFAGALAVHLALSHTGSMIGPPSLIEKILNWPQGKTKILEVFGDLSSVPDTEMLGFCKALKDWGYNIMVFTNGQVWPSWFTLANWITVNIGPDPWLAYHCHELHFLMSDADTPEPTLPPSETNNTRLYVTPGPAVTMDNVFNFIKKSKREWSILIEPSRFPQENMLPKKKKEEKK